MAGANGRGLPAAITGVGYSPMVRVSERSVIEQAAEACLHAIEDAGLRREEIGGIVEFQHNDSVTAPELATALGLENADWLVDLHGGGELSCVLPAHAAMAISAGQAKHVLCLRALNGRSGKRMGSFTGVSAPALAEFYAPFGLEATPAVFAMLAQRHMVWYGTTTEQLAAVAISQREWAHDNDRALRRDPLTFDEYLASPTIATPFRRLDCCQETDGACALVVSALDRASDLRKPPVFLRGFATAGGPGASTHFEHWRDFSETSAPYVAEKLWRSSGMTPADVDVAELYDSFTWAVLATLEGFGFCKPGEAGAFVLDGNTGKGSQLPVNTHGGLLSEGYVQGVNSVAEAVLQLRGEAGARQVPDAHVALATATGAVARGSALILATEAD
jgi:acetyl-CoA acetyltransferase